MMNLEFFIQNSNFHNLLQIPTCLFKDNFTEGILEFHEMIVSKQTSYFFKKIEKRKNYINQESWALEPLLTLC